jgi:PAS domain S-box-containing protein
VTSPVRSPGTCDAVPGPETLSPPRDGVGYAAAVGDDFDERAIFVQGPAVIFRWRNAEGWPVEYASPNVLEVFGHSAEDFTSGRVPYGTVLHPDDAARVASEVAVATATGAVTFAHERYRVLHKDGSARWLYDYTRVLRDDAGAATHYLGYVLDITDRVIAEDDARELERRLLHAQKLESLGLLAGGVAHDFNNLLTGIMAQASLARRHLASVPGSFRDALDQIEALSKRAAGLTRQLLAYSGKGRFVIEPTDVGAVVRELDAMLGLALPKATTLRLELTSDTTQIMADRAQLEQVMVNLITNAAESMPDSGGTVTVRTSLEQCDRARLSAGYGGATLAPGRYVALEVIDTGSGMNEATVGKIFDPFFTTKGAGRGLGMSAVLGIVRAHRGTIRVTSTPGAGTWFGLWFPVTEQASAAVIPASVAAPIAPRGTILVVDDEASIRNSVAASLGYLGYPVLLASDGAEALAIVDRQGGELAAAVIDMTMPVLSGPATVRELRRRAPMLPIIMTSGYSEEEAAHQIGDVPVGGFLQKPFGLEDIERTLASVLAR